MAKNVTAKKPLFGNARSHALNATRKKQGVNLQKVTINGKSVRVSARELRSLKKMLNQYIRIRYRFSFFILDNLFQSKH